LKPLETQPDAPPARFDEAHNNLVKVLLSITSSIFFDFSWELPYNLEKHH
jgi:hypothetical protein